MLRELAVSVDFDDIDIRNLLRIDSAMDEIEDQFVSMDDYVNDASKEFKDMGRDASKSLGSVKRDTGKAGDAMDEFRRDADKAGGEAKDAMDEAGDSAKKASGDIKKSSKGWDMFKKAGTGAVAAVVTAMAGLSVTMGGFYTDMEQSMDRLAAKTGTTGQELADLEGVATNVFKGAFGDSMAQVSDDVATLNAMFGDLNKDQLQTLAEGAYTISDLWGYEVKEVSRSVSTMTKTFKDLSTTDALDLLTTGLQKSGDYSDDLLDTVNEYGSTFSQLGYDAEGFMATLVAGAEAGAWNMDKLGDAAKEGFLKIGEGSDETKQALKDMGLDAGQIMSDINAGGDDAQQAFMAVSTAIGSIEDPAKRNQAAIAAFGTPIEDLGPQFQTFFSDVEQDLGNFEGATTRAADTAYNNFGTRMIGVFRDVKTELSAAFEENGGPKLLGDIATKAEELVPKISDVAGEAIEFANSVKENWPAITRIITPMAAGAATLAASFGLLKIVGTITTLMNLYKTSAFATTWAQHGLNAAMRANPIGLVITAITLLITAGVALYQNWDTVKAAAGRLWQGISSAWTNIKINTENTWYKIKSSIAGAINGIIDKINSMIGAINRIPGVNAPLVPDIRMPDMPENMRMVQTMGFRGIDGSHATGLADVPYDDYVANLHKGEAVITSEQNKTLQDAGILTKKGDKPQTNITRGGNSYNNSQTFAPHYDIKIEGAGDPQETERRVRKTVREENAKFWRQMQAKMA